MRSLSVTLKRDTGGYYLKGDWVTSETPDDIPINCSIQPYRKGEHQVVMPEGVMSKDTLVFYTQNQVKTVNQFTFKEADRYIEGLLTYVAFDVANWGRHLIRTAHYQVLFVREDKLPNGDL